MQQRYCTAKRRDENEKKKKRKLRKGLTGINEQTKALRFLTSWLFILFILSLFGSGDLTIIKRHLRVWWLLIVYCFAGNQAGKKKQLLNYLFIQFKKLILTSTNSGYIIFQIYKVAEETKFYL